MKPSLIHLIHAYKHCFIPNSLIHSKFTHFFHQTNTSFKRKHRNASHLLADLPRSLHRLKLVNQRQSHVESLLHKHNLADFLPLLHHRTSALHLRLTLLQNVLQRELAHRLGGIKDIAMGTGRRNHQEGKKAIGLFVLLLDSTNFVYRVHVPRVRFLAHKTTFRGANSIQFIKICVSAIKRLGEIVPIGQELGDIHTNSKLRSEVQRTEREK